VSPAAWTFFTVNTGLLITTVTGLVKTTRKTSKLATNTEATRKAATLAAQNTHAVANGFAGGIVSDVAEVKRLLLSVIESQVEQRRDLSTHLRQHQEIK
jgi:hypothetical protein